MAVRVDEENKTVALSVRDLAGEGGLDLFSAGPGLLPQRTILGQIVHARHQEKRIADHPGYRREVAVSHEIEVEGYKVSISGRIDGLLETEEEVLVEEVKSVFLRPEELAASSPESFPAFSDQLRIYCYITALQKKKPVRGSLILVNITTGEEKILSLPVVVEEIGALVEGRLRAILFQWREHLAALERRRLAAPALRFPFDSVRPHQDQLVEAVLRACAEGRSLLVSAPSGVGKTAAALYPALKAALASDKRVFFVTSKTTQQRIAAETLTRMAERCPAFTAVTLRAKEKICPNEACVCHEAICDYANDFLRKLEESRILDTLLALRIISPDAVLREALKARLCPFQVSLLLAERTDVVICDYNYVFDPRVSLTTFSSGEPYEDCILVIDEAHNLPERACDYYSPALGAETLTHRKNELPITGAGLFRKIEREIDKILDFLRALSEKGKEAHPGEPKFTLEESGNLLSFFRRRKKTLDRLGIEYLIYRKLEGESGERDPLLEFFSDFTFFCHVLGLEGEHFKTVYEATEWGGTLGVVCLDASTYTGQRIAGFHAAVAMSATLQPFDYYLRSLGLKEQETETIEISSPFPIENRKILILPTIDTTFRRRQRYHGETAAVIERVLALRRGNYLALFPSYRYMQDVLEHLDTDGIDVLVQSGDMSERDRHNFLAELSESREKTLLVFGVQGGIFSEGVDYPGEMLIGIIVVSPALPQVSFERELLRAYHEERLGKGFEYAYLIPGMRRVIQSSGRVIRSESDRGVILLLCRRFANPQYGNLLPRDWYVDSPLELIANDYEEEIRRFWEGE
jgi:DNA excision repair protein ERCC-2